MTIEGLQVANPPWEVPRPLLQLQRLQVQLELRPLLGGHLVLRRVEIDHPDLYLHQENSGSRQLDRRQYRADQRHPERTQTVQPPGHA